MPAFSLRPVLAAAAALALLPATAEAKCRELPSQPILPGYAYVLDGQVVGIFDMDEAPPHPPADEILAIETGCIRATDSDVAGARRAAVMVATRAGAQEMLTNTLHELAAAMDHHRASTGSFAADLEELGFFDSQMRIPIQLETRGDRWRAVARIDGAPLRCVAQGRADRHTARVRCS